MCKFIFVNRFLEKNKRSNVLYRYLDTYNKFGLKSSPCLTPQSSANISPIIVFIFETNCHFLYLHCLLLFILQTDHRVLCNKFYLRKGSVYLNLSIDKYLDNMGHGINKPLKLLERV